MNGVNNLMNEFRNGWRIRLARDRVDTGMASFR